MSGRQIVVKGFRLDKSGKIVRNKARLDVSTRLRQAASKKVKPRKSSDAGLSGFVELGSYLMSVGGSAGLLAGNKPKAKTASKRVVKK